MRLVAVDPGTRAVAWSVSEDGELRESGLTPVDGLRGVMWTVFALRPQHLLVELPQVYQGGKSKGDPNDLIRLAAVAGACATACESSRLVSPREWKGQIPKAVHHSRLRKALSEAEERHLERSLRLVARRLQHNVLDAVGLNLWALGRLG